MRRIYKITCKKKVGKLPEIPMFNIFSLGNLNLTLIIEFNDKDLIKTIDGQTKQISIKDINNVSQLDFIKDNNDLINRIKIKSENDSINQFLLLSKTSIQKRQIEFFPFYSPKFEGKALFFKDIFQKITKRYGLLINGHSLDKNQSYSIKIFLKYKDENNFFDYIEERDKETDNEIKEESYVTQQTKEIKNTEEEKDNDEDNEYVKKGLIPKFKRKGCMLSKLKPNCQKFDLIYLNYTDLLNMEGDCREDDFIELFKFFKEKKTKIFINYFKPEKSDLVVPPEEDEKEDDENSDNEDFNSINENNEDFNSINENNENNENKGNDNGKNENKGNENEKNENNENNENSGNKENNEEEEKDEKPKKMFYKQKKLNILYNLTDIYFFDEKQAYELFDKHLKYFSEDKSIDKLSKAKLYDYFISSIAGNSKGSQEKIGLFLYELEKFTIVTCSKNSGVPETLDSKLYPPTNARNIQLINQYRAIVQQNKDEYYLIFLSLMLKALSCGNKNLSEEINYTFKDALTIIKKDIECKKNKIQFNLSKLVNYKSIQTDKTRERGNYSQKSKEKGFVLDCLNPKKSQLKEYVPLKDGNLKLYFRSKSNMKYLMQKGFVDREGYIMYDREYRRSLGSLSKVKSETNKSDKNISKILFQLSFKNQNNNYLLPPIIRTREKLPI